MNGPQASPHVIVGATTCLVSTPAGPKLTAPASAGGVRRQAYSEDRKLRPWTQDPDERRPTIPKSFNHRFELADRGSGVFPSAGRRSKVRARCRYLGRFGGVGRHVRVNLPFPSSCLHRELLPTPESTPPFSATGRRPVSSSASSRCRISLASRRTAVLRIPLSCGECPGRWVRSGISSCEARLQKGATGARRARPLAGPRTRSRVHERIHRDSSCYRGRTARPSKPIRGISAPFPALHPFDGSRRSRKAPQLAGIQISRWAVDAPWDGSHAHPDSERDAI